MKLEPIDRAFEDWDALLSLILASFAYTHPRIDSSSALRLTPQSLKQKAKTEKAYAAIENVGWLAASSASPNCRIASISANSPFFRMRRVEVSGD